VLVVYQVLIMDPEEVAAQAHQELLGLTRLNMQVATEVTEQPHLFQAHL
jgi:ribosomal protein L29